MYELRIKYQYVNQYGLNIIGSVETSENVDVRVKVVRSPHRCGYTIAWDGRYPAMAEWADIAQAIKDELERMFDETVYPVLDHSTV